MKLSNRLLGIIIVVATLSQIASAQAAESPEHIATEKLRSHDTNMTFDR